jgi:aspartate dehydrogenase
MRRIGVVGLGAIGREICAAILAGTVHAELAGVADQTPDMAAAAMEKAGLAAPCMRMEALLDACDLVVEATSKAAAGAILEAALARGRDIVLLSAGAILDDYETARARAAWTASRRVPRPGILPEACPEKPPACGGILPCRFPSRWRRFVPVPGRFPNAAPITSGEL